MFVDKNILSVQRGRYPELFFYEALLLRNRKRKIPKSGIMSDIAWSDPDDSTTLT
jgi:hypothetical protein